MDKNSIGYTHVFTWEQFQRALVYTKSTTGWMPLISIGHWMQNWKA